MQNTMIDNSQWLLCYPCEAVKYQWNGVLEQNTGLKYWNWLINAKNLIYCTSWVNGWLSDMITGYQGGKNT